MGKTRVLTTRGSRALGEYRLKQMTLIYCGKTVKEGRLLSSDIWRTAM